MPQQKVYWITPLGSADDFGIPFDKVMYDAKTRMGPWANMAPSSFRTYGLGRLGTGFGQKYEKQADGRWLKVEG